jgi:hypothetical protein
MLAHVEDHISKIEMRLRVSAGKVLGREAEEFDTGMYVLILNLVLNHLTIAAARFF